MLSYAPKTSRIEYESQSATTNPAAVDRARYTPTSGSARPYCFGAGRRPAGERGRRPVGNLSQDGALVAHAFCGARPGSHVAVGAPAFCGARPGSLVAGGVRARAQADLWAREDQSDRGCDAANQASGDDPLELPVDGPEPGGEQVHDQQHLAESPSQAAPGETLQAVARPPISGEADRRGWALFEPSAAGDGDLRGREEPNSGSRSHAAGSALEKRALRHDDA